MNPLLLLEQAERLMGAGPGRPRQADLRRAVSAAYYALFHLLIRDGTRRVTADDGLRSSVARVYSHGEMRAASVALVQNTLPRAIRSLVSSVPDDLHSVAQALIDLQEDRHRADYDLRPAGGFTREMARVRIRQTRDAFVAWERVRTDPAAEVYLIAMLLHQKLGR
ncbi:MAG TPA: hypothetical protein VFG68_09720 [Fimbriiglobus sp.]|nr:hypothetical protein [Fimbriiglobus sp.]